MLQSYVDIKEELTLDSPEKREFWRQAEDKIETWKRRLDSAEESSS
ncbi:hypothetical protein D9611_006999 [Ephemerocybe angulata]|uniref:Uncharacterized protein n=1 Tax=Ephemerocybe angulata TaxID=980116 RepID=A0A8H5EVQ1_9AGAR|nr:hypothetical protein D9611_006999 [Tulosesus angulatus]